MARIDFIDWRPHNRRAKSLAADLGATLYLAPNFLRPKFLAPFRYIYLTFWSAAILLHRRPDIVIVSSPPSFLPILALACSKVLSFRYIVDAHHTATIGYWSWVPFGFAFNRYVMNQALTTLLHNEILQQMSAARGVRSVTMETKIPSPVSGAAQAHHHGRFSVLVPCSFDPDEPIETIYRAASSIPDTRFYLAGDARRLRKSLRENHPPNVILTGFLFQADYDKLLGEVDVVMALTTNEDPVRPRAVTEAIGAQKPLLASRNPATELHLSAGACLLENNSADIVDALIDIRQNYEHYRNAMTDLKERRRAVYQRQLEKLGSLLNLDPSMERHTTF